jgi:hypothetical protein
MLFFSPLLFGADVIVMGLGGMVRVDKDTDSNSFGKLAQWFYMPCSQRNIMADDNDEVEPLQDWLKAMKKNEMKLDGMTSPLSLANQFAQTLANAKAAELDIVVPELAREWASEVIQDFAFLVADVARDAGMSSRLINRDLFDPNKHEAIEWNEGIRFDDVLPYPEANIEPEFWEDLEDNYQEIGDEPSSMWRFFQKTPPDLRLSGQYNRLFPLKIVMRVAANLLMNAEKYTVEGEDGPETAQNPLFLEDLRLECANVARYAKARMAWLDSNNGTEFGTWFSVALTDGTKKQNERFMSQFVGSVRNSGQGLPFELGFLENDDGIVKITKSGVEFTLEENPIIDSEEDWNEKATLSKREKLLLVRAIDRNAAGEGKLIRSIIGWIKEGINTPKQIEKEIIEAYDLNSTEASLARTGALARMQELGIVLRNKSGRNVMYELP